MEHESPLFRYTREIWYYIDKSCIKFSDSTNNNINNIHWNVDFHFPNVKQAQNGIIISTKIYPTFSKRSSYTNLWILHIGNLKNKCLYPWSRTYYITCKRKYDGGWVTWQPCRPDPYLIKSVSGAIYRGRDTSFQSLKMSVKTCDDACNDISGAISEDLSAVTR